MVHKTNHDQKVTNIDLHTVHNYQIYQKKLKKTALVIGNECAVPTARGSLLHSLGCGMSQEGDQSRSRDVWSVGQRLNSLPALAV